MSPPKNLWRYVGMGACDLSDRYSSHAGARFCRCFFCCLPSLQVVLLGFPMLIPVIFSAISGCLLPSCCALSVFASGRARAVGDLGLTFQRDVEAYPQKTPGGYFWGYRGLHDACRCWQRRSPYSDFLVPTCLPARRFVGRMAVTGTNFHYLLSAHSANRDRLSVPLLLAFLQADLKCSLHSWSRDTIRQFILMPAAMANALLEATSSLISASNAAGRGETGHPSWSRRTARAALASAAALTISRLRRSMITRGRALRGDHADPGLVARGRYPGLRPSSARQASSEVRDRDGHGERDELVVPDERESRGERCGHEIDAPGHGIGQGLGPRPR